MLLWWNTMTKSNCGWKAVFGLRFPIRVYHWRKSRQNLKQKLKQGPQGQGCCLLPWSPLLTQSAFLQSPGPPFQRGHDQQYAVLFHINHSISKGSRGLPPTQYYKSKFSVQVPCSLISPYCVHIKLASTPSELTCSQFQIVSVQSTSSMSICSSEFWSENWFKSQGPGSSFC